MDRLDVRRSIRKANGRRRGRLSVAYPTLRFVIVEQVANVGSPVWLVSVLVSPCRVRALSGPGPIYCCSVPLRRM